MALFVIIIVSIVLAVLLYLKGRSSSGNDDIHGQPPDAGDMGGNL